MKMKVEKRLQRQLASLKSCLKVYKFCSFLQKQLQTHLQEIKEATVIFSRIKIKACYHPWAVSLFIMVSYTAVVKGTIMRFLTTHICPQCQVTCSYSLSLAKTERQRRKSELNYTALKQKEHIASQVPRDCLVAISLYKSSYLKGKIVVDCLKQGLCTIQKAEKET